MSDAELETVWEAIKTQFADEHENLYGVSFAKWTELVWGEIDRRKKEGNIPV